MGTDWKLLDEGAQRCLDLQGSGTWLHEHTEVGGWLTLEGVRRALHAHGTECSDSPWRGIWTFVREAHEAGRAVRLVSEHQEGFDPPGWAQLSVYARTGEYTRKGYGLR